MRHDGDTRRKVLVRGTVLVDPKAALAKMRAYQLADPIAYVLELVRAAVWSGATAVHLANDSDDLILWHDGPAPAVDDLSRILEHLFSVSDRRLRLLAVAINTALGLGVRFVDLDTTHGAPPGKLLRVRWTPTAAAKNVKDDDDRPLALATQSAVDRPPNMPEVGFRIHVREAFGLEVMREWLRRDPRETQLLRGHVHRLSVPLMRDGVNLVPSTPTAPLFSVPFTDADLSGEIALLRADDPRANRLEFHELGVLLESRPLHPHQGTDGPPLWMLVESRSLPTNVSRSKVDTSGSLGSALARVWRSALDTLVTQSLEALQPDTPWTSVDDPRGALHDTLLTWILSGGAPWSAHVGSPPTAPDDTALGDTPSTVYEKLLAAPLLPLGTGHFTSPAKAASNAARHLLWRGPDPIEADLTPWIHEVLWLQRGSRPLRAVLDALKPLDAGPALRIAQDVRARYARFRAHPSQPVALPLSGPELARVPLEASEGYKGQIVLPGGDHEGPGPLRLRAFLDDRPFAVEDVDTAAAPLWVALQAPGVRPKSSFDAVERGPMLVEALRPVRRRFVDAAEALAGFWLKTLPHDDPRGAWLGDAAEGLHEDSRRALVRAAWVELARLDPEAPDQTRAVTEGLTRYPALASYPAWVTTRRGHCVSLEALVAQSVAPPQAVLRAGWTVQGSRRDGRDVVKFQRQEEAAVLARAVAPKVSLVDLGDRLPTRTTDDLRLLLSQGDAMRDAVPSLALTRPLARCLVAPVNADRGALRLAHHATLLGSRPHEGILGPVDLLVEDDTAIPAPSTRWTLNDVLGPDATVLLRESEVALAETLALALQGDRVARGRLLGPLGRLDDLAVTRYLLTALGRLHGRPLTLSHDGITPAAQAGLREILQQTPMLLWFGATGETRKTSPAQLEPHLGPDGQRSVSFVNTAPEGVDPADLQALVLTDRTMRPWVESALRAKLVYVGDDLPKLQAKALRRKARASLAQKSKVVFDDPTSLAGIGPAVEHEESTTGRVLALLGREAQRARIEILVDGRVALSLLVNVPTELPVPLAMRVEFVRPMSLADDLGSLTGTGWKALRALCLAVTPEVLDAHLRASLDPTTLEPLRSLVLRWAEATQGQRGPEVSRRKTEIAKLPLWPTVGGALVSLAAITQHTKRLSYAVLPDEFEWIAQGPDEAPDPLVLRVRNESELRALSQLTKASSDAQTAAVEHLQRARRLRVHARDRIRLPGSPAHPVLAGRLEDLCPSLGVGELRVVARDEGLMLSVYVADGTVHTSTRPAPLGLELALGSAAIDPANVTASLATLDLMPRVLDATRILLGRLADTWPERPAPWIERALRWYLLTTPGLDEAARQRPLLRDSTGAPLCLADLDQQIARHRTVAYVSVPPTEPIASSIPGRRVAVLSPTDLRWLLAHRAVDDFTKRLDDDLAAQRWARATPAAVVRLPEGTAPRVLARRTHTTPEGEVALLAWDAISVGEVHWHVTRRPLGQSPLSTPWPAAVALEAPDLTPNGRRNGPVEDAAFQIAMTTARSLVEDLLREELGPPDDAWTALAAHETKSPAYAAGNCNVVGWLWLMPHQRPGRVRVQTASGERWVGTSLQRHDGSNFDARFQTEVPVHGHLWVKSRTAQTRAEQDATARRVTELVVRWAWPRLLEALCLHNPKATHTPEGWWQLGLAALSGQLGHGALREHAKQATPPGATLTLQRIQRAVSRAEPLRRGVDVREEDAPWVKVFHEAGMLVTPPKPVAAPKPAPAPAPAPTPAPTPATPPARPAPTAPAPKATPASKAQPVADATARFPMGENTLTLLHDLGLDRAALRGIEADPRPCSLAAGLVHYDPSNKIALVRVEHPAVLKLRQGAARRGAEVLAVAVLGAVNRALEGVTDADEERILAGLLERLRRK